MHLPDASAEQMYGHTARSSARPQSQQLNDLHESNYTSVVNVIQDSEGTGRSQDVLF